MSSKILQKQKIIGKSKISQLFEDEIDNSIEKEVSYFKSI